MPNAKMEVSGKRLRRGSVLCSVPIIALFGLFEFADVDSGSAQEFEVCLIKQTPPGTVQTGIIGGPGTASPGQIQYVNYSLIELVAIAYDVMPYQVVGPTWATKRQVDVIAKTPPSAVKADVPKMLRGALADQLRLKAHQGRADLQRYVMVVGPHGAKLPQVGAGQIPEGYPRVREFSGSGMKSAAQSGGKASLIAQQQSMDELGKFLSNELNSAVLNMTGLVGRFDFSLYWFSENVYARFPPVPTDGRTTDEPSVSLTSALKSELGLELSKGKGPMDTVVIDHLEDVE
jgi:uncharacterized protein (TIGR03435 family)